MKIYIFCCRKFDTLTYKIENIVIFIAQTILIHLPTKINLKLKQNNSQHFHHHMTKLLLYIPKETSK